jgi:hypothetical protein
MPYFPQDSDIPLDEELLRFLKVLYKSGKLCRVVVEHISPDRVFRIALKLKSITKSA